MELVTLPISPVDGADRIWMLEYRAIDFINARTTITSLLRDPIGFITSVINSDRGEEDIPFHRTFPVIITFQYVLAPTRDNPFPFLIKGEYGTNNISVLCPLPFSYSTDSKIIDTMFELWNKTSRRTRQRKTNTKTRSLEENIRKNTTSKILDITIVEKFKRFYAHFDINVPGERLPKSGSNVFECFANFAINPMYLVEASNRFNPEDVRISLWNGDNLIAVPQDQRFRFQRFTPVSIKTFELQYTSPPTKHVVLESSRASVRTMSAASVIVSTDPCVKLTGDLTNNPPPPNGYKWSGHYDNGNLTGWTLVPVDSLPPGN